MAEWPSNMLRPPCPDDLRRDRDASTGQATYPLGPVRSERVRAVLTWRALPAFITFTDQSSRHSFDLGEDPCA